MTSRCIYGIYTWCIYEIHNLIDLFGSNELSCTILFDVCSRSYLPFRADVVYIRSPVWKLLVSCLPDLAHKTMNTKS